MTLIEYMRRVHWVERGETWRLTLDGRDLPFELLPLAGDRWRAHEFGNDCPLHVGAFEQGLLAAERAAGIDDG